MNVKPISVIGDKHRQKAKGKVIISRWPPRDRSHTHTQPRSAIACTDTYTHTCTHLHTRRETWPNSKRRLSDLTAWRSLERSITKRARWMGKASRTATALLGYLCEKAADSLLDENRRSESIVLTLPSGRWEEGREKAAWTTGCLSLDGPKSHKRKKKKEERFRQNFAIWTGARMLVSGFLSRPT